jgi:Tetratricopeptide repeat
MKKQSFKALGLIFISAVGFTACNGLSKLVKNSGEIKYKVSPEVMAVHGDSVQVTITGTYPAKVFPKKATVTANPVIVYKGGEVAFEPVVLIGEQVEGKGQKIKYANGGSFSYTSNKVPYSPDMKVAILELRATGKVKEKQKNLPGTKIADGIITTSLLVKNDDKTILAKDAFTKDVTRQQKTNIFFAMNQAQVTYAQLRGDEMDALKAFVKETKAKGAEFQGMEVSAYASPDGELSRNENLAVLRAKTSTKEIMNIFKSLGIKAATTAEFYNTITTAEDWDGFKTAMEASSIEDKELILRVLTMYPDGETRETEIKNLSATYEEVANIILPKLRRSVLTLKVVEKSRTDAEISKLATSNPDMLSVEELLYAATLTEDLNTQVEIYKAAQRLFPADWRTSNNLGCVSLMQNNLDEAKAAFEKADGLKEGNSIVKNNLGVIARRSGDRAKAMELYSSATDAGVEVAYNIAIIELQNGEYASAVSKFGDNSTFNSALAKLLSEDTDGAMSAISNSNDKDAASSFYLKAIIAARKGSTEEVLANLTAAIGKDGSFKQMAAEDAEFLKFKDSAEFKALIGE